MSAGGSTMYEMRGEGTSVFENELAGETCMRLTPLCVRRSSCTPSLSMGDELAAYAVARGYARKLVVAGVFEPEHGALVDFERSDWDLTMNLDLTSIFTMCKKVGGYTAV